MILLDKKEIQKRRMMGYFMDATKKIIEEEGIESITVRKVADLAGYNSATLYNYFENLEHLIYFSSMIYLKEYVDALPQYLKDCKSAMDKYFVIWKCFCLYSFNKPKIYHALFFDRYSHSLKDSIQQYYSIFTEELGEQSEDLSRMLLKPNIYDRNRTLLENCSKEGTLPKENIDFVNEMSLLLYQGMLDRVLNNQTNYSLDESSDRTIKYFKQIVKSFGGKID